ncbi:MAG: glycine cleavage system protein GcvH [Candidatus Bipolaricaulota bacterium]|nr:glycine cleavage system protein GcvH [Candidatus Bipolaricaulota bacterium]
MNYPSEFRYTKEHEWVKLEGNRAKMGITDHAQAELGDIVFIELPTVGLEIKKGDNLATVESVKAAGEVYAPISGKVIEVNTELESSPEIINSSPHNDGWIAVLEITDPSAADDLLDVASYEQYLSAE